MQKKAAEVCKAEVNSLTTVNKYYLFAEDLIILKQSLKEAIGMKKKIEKETNTEVENKVGDKKQVVNGKILKTVRIMLARMNPVDRRGKADLEKAVGNTNKLLDLLPQAKRMLSWKVKTMAGTGEQND